MKGFSGHIHKSASVFSNDPDDPRITLVIKGKITSLVEIKPSSTLLFRGRADQLVQKSVDVVATSKPFQITKVDSNLDDKITYQVKTIEAGKQYKLNVKNQAKEGSYRGYIKISTDMAQRPEVLIHVAGNIEGAISIRPQSIMVGKLRPDQPARSAKVLVISNLNKAFEITNMTYDHKFIDVSKQPLPQGKTGYSLEIVPKLENLPSGTKPMQQKVKLVIETSAEPQLKQEVKVYLIRR